MQDKITCENVNEFENIEGLSGYQILPKCPWTIRNTKTGKDLKPYLSNGYYAVSVRVGDKSTKKYMHEIIATKYLNYEKDKGKIKFKDNDIKNYDRENLEVQKKHQKMTDKIIWDDVDIEFINIKDSFNFNEIDNKYPYDLNSKDDYINLILDLRKVFAVVRASPMIYVFKDFRKGIAKLTYTTVGSAKERMELIKLSKFGNKDVTAWQIFKEYSELFIFDEFCFYYNKNPKAFTYFRGYDYELVEEFDHKIIEPFLNHIKEVICNGDDILANYLNSWFSLILRDPSCKLTTALVILGEQGTGKNVFTDVWSELLGRYACRNITDIDHITGKYNATIENKKLIVCNELQSVEQSKYMNSDKLKTILTENTFTCRDLYLSAREADNVANFIFVSNNLNPLKIENRDRRYVVLKTSNKRMQNTKYFRELCSSFTEEFYNQLFTYYMQKVELKGFEYREIPMTEAKQDIIDASKPPVELFIEANYNKIENLTGAEFFKMWDDWREINKYTACSSKTFLMNTKKFTGGAKQKRINGARPYVYNLLPEVYEELKAKYPIEVKKKKPKIDDKKNMNDIKIALEVKDVENDKTYVENDSDDDW
jgi:hypothetical protein